MTTASAAVSCDTLFDKAFALHAVGNVDDAEILYREIIAQQPNHGHALHSLGLIAYGHGRLAKAIKWLRRAVASSPGEAVFHNSLAVVYWAFGNATEAIANLNTATLLNPEMLGPWENLSSFLSQLGKTEEARQAGQKVIELERRADAYNKKGLSLVFEKRFEEAHANFRAGIACNPHGSHLYSNLGQVLVEMGDLDGAVTSLLQAVKLAPNSSEIRLSLSQVFFKRGDRHSAIDEYKKVIALNPTWLEARVSFAMLLRECGALDEAILALQEVLAIRSDFLSALRDLGALLMLKRDWHQAAAYYENCCQRFPQDATFWHQHGLVLVELKSYEEAIVTWKRAAQLEPQNATPLYYLGAMYINLRQFGEAELYLKQSIALKYLIPEQYGNLARTLHYQGKADEALSYYRLTLDLNPSAAQSWVDLGGLLIEFAELEEARRCFIKALDLAPQNTEAQFDLAMILLKQGEFQPGWEAYESRRALNAFRPNIEQVGRLCCPEWRGQPLSGCSLLICAEQGLGDSLQFFRYVQAIVEFGNHITFVCPSSLVRILRANTTANVVEQTPSDATYDYYCFLMSLPFLLDTRLDSIPSKVPYLYAEPTLIQEWQLKLHSNGKLKVGLAWAGKCREGALLALTDSRRSIHFSALERLLDTPGAQFYSLQKGEPATQAFAAIEDGRLTDWTEQLDDFADTAALIANLDIVISVDTSVAHLSAAMGKPTWILSRLDGCWRWLQDRDDSPWYPSVRLFRQSQRGDWSEAIASVAAALTAMVASPIKA